MGGRLLILFLPQILQPNRTVAGLRHHWRNQSRVAISILTLLIGVIGGCASPPTATTVKAPVVAESEPDSDAIIEYLITPSLSEIAAQINDDSVNPDNARLGWQQLELLLQEQHRPLQAAKILLTLDPMLTDRAARAENHQRLWDLLQQLSDLDLNFARMPPPDTLGGWISLVLIERNSPVLETAYQSLDDWRSRYPNHAANETFALWQPELQLQPDRTANGIEPPVSRRPDRDQGQIEASVSPPTLDKVALLLPLSGRYERQAEAVRDGFLAAWFADTIDPRPLRMQIYDTTADGVVMAYERALEAGNRLVIGPLRKDAIATLICNVPISVPVLALNQLSAALFETGQLKECAPQRMADFFYQFALSPEDEAQLTARRAFYDGHSQTLAFAPEGDWGQRVLDVFVDEFERLGGLVIEKIRYTSNAGDMSSLVASGLQIDHSKDRLWSLEKILQRDLSHRTYRREDVDSIFMLAFARSARQLRPLFDFYRAHDLPIYATSHVYAEVQNPARNSDLNRVQFSDMPWVLSPTAAARLLQSELQQAWPDASIQINRLHAFGADAYRLIEPVHSTVGKKWNLSGHTGELVMAADGQIHRRLLWARFVAGVPQLIDVEISPQADP